jgi:hypothetical protein
VCVRELGGEIGAAVIIDFAGRAVLSSARQRAGVVMGGSQVGEVHSGLVLICLWLTARQNLRQSQVPALLRPVSLLYSEILSVSGRCAV